MRAPKRATYKKRKRRKYGTRRKKKENEGIFNLISWQSMAKRIRNGTISCYFCCALPVCVVLKKEYNNNFMQYNFHSIAGTQHVINGIILLFQDFQKIPNSLFKFLFCSFASPFFSFLFF